MLASATGTPQAVATACASSLRPTPCLFSSDEPEAQQVAVGLLQRCCQTLGVELAGLHERLAGRHALVGRLAADHRRIGERGRGSATGRRQLIGFGLAESGHGDRSSDLSAVR